MVDHKKFQVTLCLRSRDGSFEDCAPLANSGEDQKPIVVEYPIEGSSSLTSPAELSGMLALVRDEKLVRIHRTPCTGRPRYCSAGSLKLVSTDINVEERRERIRKELEEAKERLDPVLVRSEVFVDPLLIARDSDRKELQRVFAEVLAGAFENGESGNGGRSHARSVVDVAKFAVGLHDDATQVSSLNRTILNAYVALGDWSRIKHDGGESLQTAKESCPDSLVGGDRFQEEFGESCETYAEILRLNAVGWFEQKARYSSTEIRVALGMLEQAIVALGKDDLGGGVRQLQGGVQIAGQVVCGRRANADGGPNERGAENGGAVAAKGSGDSQSDRRIGRLMESNGRQCGVGACGEGSSC